MSVTSASYESADKQSAIEAMENDLPWTVAFSISRTCLQSTAPYTIRFGLGHGETFKTVDCLRPWRTNTWLCLDVDRADIPDDEECGRKIVSAFESDFEKS